MSDKGEQMSSILDDAREKIAKIQCLIEHTGQYQADKSYNPDIDELWETHNAYHRDYLAGANQILSISGTKDIECGCDLPEICAACKGTSIIPYKWKVSVTLENGEQLYRKLPPSGNYPWYDYEKVAGYVQEVKE